MNIFDLFPKEEQDGKLLIVWDGFNTREFVKYTITNVENNDTKTSVAISVTLPSETLDELYYFIYHHSCTNAIFYFTTLMYHKYENIWKHLGKPKFLVHVNGIPNEKLI